MEARDKHGESIKKGDSVEFVHFGEHHVATVEDISEAQGHHHVHASVKVAVPSAGCVKCEHAHGRAPRKVGHVRSQEVMGARHPATRRMAAAHAETDQEVRATAEPAP